MSELIRRFGTYYFNIFSCILFLHQSRGIQWIKIYMYMFRKRSCNFIQQKVYIILKMDNCTHSDHSRLFLPLAKCFHIPIVPPPLHALEIFTFGNDMRCLKKNNLSRGYWILADYCHGLVNLQNSPDRIRVTYWALDSPLHLICVSNYSNNTSIKI